MTRLLARWAAGDRIALEALTPIVYAELRRIAEGYLRRERQTHTLQPTALVHEAWMRLLRQDELAFAHRKQFYGLAAHVMRSILVDHARALRRRSLDLRLGTAAAERARRQPPQPRPGAPVAW